MRIQIDGTNTQNKGAELMLYAILEQIEKTYPNAQVFFNALPISNYKEIKTNLEFKRRFLLDYGKLPKALLYRLKLPYTIFTEFYPKNNIDLVLDASGFSFGDQWNYKEEHLDKLENYYRQLKKNGTKIILLPQAFGPFQTNSGRRSVAILNKYADLVIARETTSGNFLIEGGMEPNKILIYPDFTILTKGILLNKFRFIKDMVCIIPNKKMITHATQKHNEYLLFLETIIYFIRKKGRNVFLLNHEGIGDLEICNQLNKTFNDELQIISGLNSKEIKGVIGASYLVISSRYHGVASALNQGIPCLATSWSHKYETLFHDFGLSGYILDVTNFDELSKNIIEKLLESSSNKKMRLFLGLQEVEIQRRIESLWEKVWEKAIN